MKKSSAFLLCSLLLGGCGDAPPYEDSRHINLSERDKDQQMVAALKSVSLSSDITKHRHFHVVDLEEERQRMTRNLHSVIVDSRVEVVSIGCEKKKSCVEVVEASLRSASLEKVRRDDLLIVLPDFLELPNIQGLAQGYKFSTYAAPDI